MEDMVKYLIVLGVVLGVGWIVGTFISQIMDEIRHQEFLDKQKRKRMY